MTDFLSSGRRALLDRLLDAEGAGDADFRVPVYAGDRSRAPLSFGQERLYVTERLRPGSPMYVVSGALRFRGDLSTPLLRTALDQLVRRHDTLRTSFEEDETGVRQVVLPPDRVNLDLRVTPVGADEVKSRVAEAAARGFDLSRPPLLRAELLEVRGAVPEWFLVLSVHHIVVDGWSLGLLADELGELYRRLARGEAGEPDPARIGYLDFAMWQREFLSGDLLATQLAYWRDQLRALPADTLPTDRPRPPERTFAGDSVPLTLRPAVVSALGRVAAEERATPFMAFTAAFAAVLGRLSGQDDVVVGTPLAGRRRAELESVVGFFVNTVPLRVPLAGDPSFRDLLAVVRDVCTGAYQHQDVPFERIIHELRLERDVSGQTSLARYWIVLHNNPPRGFEAPGVTCAVEPALVGTVRCDLSVQLVPDADGGITGWLEYSTELFDAATAERLVRAFGRFLEAAAGRPDDAVAALPLMPPEERDRVLREWSAPAATAMSGPGVAAAIRAQVERAPSATAVLDDTDGRRITYAELDRHAAALADRLRSVGIGPEDRVAVCLPRGAHLVSALLGVLKAGAVYVPLDPDHPPARTEQLVREVSPAAVLTTVRDAGRFAGQGLVILVEAAGAEPAAPGAGTSPAPQNASTVLFTSGSTGAPKGVVGTYAGLDNRLLALQAAHRLTPADRVLHKAPIGFDVSLWEMLWPLCAGATVVLSRPDGHRDMSYLHDLIDRAGVTVCHFVPSLAHLFLDADPAAHPGPRLVFSGGEALTGKLAVRLLDRFPGAELVNQYGPTETVIDVSAGTVTVADAGDRVSIGRPAAGVELYVLDERFQPQPVGAAGQLFVGGVQVARGYLGRPGETAAAFVPHPFDRGRRLYATGDRARLLPDGSFAFLGRVDRQVKVGGNRVEPGEIEAVLRAHPGVERALVTTRADGAGQVQLIAYVNPPAGVAPHDAVTLGHLRERLPSVLVPAHLVTLSDWPVTPNGKVDVDALPVPEVTGPVADEPANALEAAIATIFADLLEIEKIGREESFFELGGNSLLAIRAVSRIRANLDVRLQIGQIFQATTVSALAGLIAGADPDSVSRAAGRPAAGGTPPVAPGAGDVGAIPRLDRTARRR